MLRSALKWTVTIVDWSRRLVVKRREWNVETFPRSRMRAITADEILTSDLKIFSRPSIQHFRNYDPITHPCNGLPLTIPKYLRLPLLFQRPLHKLLQERLRAIEQRLRGGPFINSGLFLNGKLPNSSPATERTNLTSSTAISTFTPRSLRSPMSNPAFLRISSDRGFMTWALGCPNRSGCRSRTMLR